MKIKEITLCESNIIRPDIADCVRIITQYCAPYLRQIKGNLTMYPIYRGINTHKYGSQVAAGLWKYPVRATRQSVDTPAEIHKLFDDWFLRKFGIRYRSNVVFGTGSSSNAAMYGKLHILLPIGDFSFCWSPFCEDLYEEFEGDISSVDEWLDELQFTQSNLISAISSGNEIMINCNSYYLLDAQILRMHSEQLASLCILVGK